MIFMGIVGNLEKLLNDAREYAERSVDNYKLTFVEDVSLILGDMACRVVVFMLLFVIFILLLMILAVVLASLIGLPLSLLAVIAVIAAVAAVVYKMRERLFTDHFVRLLCGMLFKKEEKND